MALTMVAAYDIASDARRARLAALLQCHGNRIQRSVFLIELDPETFAQVLERAKTLMDLDEDSLYFFRQCGPCWEAVGCLGQAEPPKRCLYWAVL